MAVRNLCEQGEGKLRVRFPSKAKARRALLKAKHQGLNVARVYECYRCGDFHLTSSKEVMMCPDWVAKEYCEKLLGDADFRLPVPPFRPAWHHFSRLSTEDAYKEFRQMEMLPEGFRVRDLMERMETEVA